MVTILGAGDAMATEEAAYTVTARDGAFEVRDCAPHVVAETLVEGTLEEDGAALLCDCDTATPAGVIRTADAGLSAPDARRRLSRQDSAGHHPPFRVG
jgi:hypothetical protein